MKMELYYVADITTNSMAENPQEEIARYVAGPFGSWDKAIDVKKQKEDKYFGVHYELVTQVIEVEKD